MNQTEHSSKNLIVPAAVIGIIIFGVLTYIVSRSSTMQKSVQEETRQETITNTQTHDTTNQQTEITQEQSQQESSKYKDGTYTATSSYMSPAGSKEIEVTVTIQNNVVTDTSFRGINPDPVSRRYQNEFSQNYKAFVVGKNIDEIVLGKVSGSSLTPKGFNDALEKIKNEAKS
ncbi:MAG: hypothetical protein N3A54_03545 [Patescibacteria group bacterium]|nr:hypothetical protein [Patescibacteria group bacterium]